MTGEGIKKKRDPIFSVCFVVFVVACVGVLGVYVDEHYIQSDDTKVAYGDTVEVNYTGSYYGYYTELVFSRDYEGAEGKTRMASIMKDLRSLEAGQTFVGRRIASVEDLLGEGTGFPKADVVIIRFESGEKLVVRPSGTEPKIKYYIFLVEGKGGRSALEENRGAILDEFKAAL